VSLSNLLTASRLKDARACQRLHRLKYGLGYRPVADVEALRFGTLIHKALEAWWIAKRDGQDPMQAALTALAGGEPFEKAKAEALMEGYDVRWRDQPYEILAVEAEFIVDLRNPATGKASRTWRLSGKIDAVVRDLRTGLIYIVEHKTSSENITSGSEYWRRLRIDGQVSIYFEGGRALGYDVAGCIYDVLGKPGQKPLKANKQREADETPDEYRLRCGDAIAEDPDRFYQRGEVVRLEEEMADALFDIWQLGQQIREAELAERFPRNPDACVRFGRTCPFFGVCCGDASLDDPQHFRRIDNVHPELVQEADDATPG
jgi:hypothetical protein